MSDRKALLNRALTALSGLWVSFPHDGYCSRCGEDLVERYAYQLNQDKPIAITGCPKCHRSFCE